MSLIVTRRLSHDAGAQPLDENGNPLLQKTFVMVLDGKEVKTAAVWRGPLCSCCMPARAAAAAHCRHVLSWIVVFCPAFILLWREVVGGLSF